MFDITGNKFRKIQSITQQQYNSKYYIYNKKVFGIVRMDVIKKMHGESWVEFSSINVVTKKLNKHFIPESSFFSRRYFETLKNAKKTLVNKEKVGI
jgi:hypothetical protein